MATLDTTGLIAIRFQAATVQTLGGKAFTHATGSIVAIPNGTASITVDVTTVVGCMLLATEALGNRENLHLSFFSLDELRTPVA